MIPAGGDRLIRPRLVSLVARGESNSSITLKRPGRANLPREPRPDVWSGLNEFVYRQTWRWDRHSAVCAEERSEKLVERRTVCYVVQKMGRCKKAQVYALFFALHSLDLSTLKCNVLVYWSVFVVLDGGAEYISSV